MPYTPTSARAVKDHVYSALAALLPDVQVTKGHPGDAVEGVWVMLGDIEYESSAWAALGQSQRDERYTITLNVDYMFPGGSADEAEEAAYALYAQIEEWVRSNPFVPYGRVTEIQVSPDRSTAYPYSGGWCCLIESQIAVHSRI